MDISLREIECFIAVAEELSFTRAAQRLHLAQPPLSRHIRTLEEKLAITLFNREPRNVSLTPAGLTFYEEVRSIPRRIERAGNAAKRTALGEVSRLRLGFVSAVMNDALTDVFRNYRQAFQEVQIILQDLPPQHQLSAIIEGRLDAGFVGMKPKEQIDGLCFIPWYKEPLICMVPMGHPLENKKRIKIEELAEERFISVSHQSAPAFVDYVNSLCHASGFHPRIILESPRAQAVAMMVAAGSGIALLPEALVDLFHHSVKAIPLHGKPMITHVLAYRNHAPSKALNNLLRLIRTS